MISGVVVVVVGGFGVLLDTVLDTVVVTRRVWPDVLRIAAKTTIMTRSVATTTIVRPTGRFLRDARRRVCRDAPRADSGRYHLPSAACHHPGPSETSLTSPTPASHCHWCNA